MSNLAPSRLKSAAAAVTLTPSRLPATRQTNQPQSQKVSALKKWRWVLLALAALTIIGLIAFTIFFLIVANNLPAPNQVVRETGFSTRIYDRNGVLLYDFYQDQRRDPVALNQIDQDLINATIAIEDKDFYNHQGFDYLTIFRIPYYYLTRQRVVGGSTLTQQLTKMMLLSSERKVIRKFRELILSMQIEELFTKEEILEMYLNEAPYGGNLVGASLAAKTYFQTTVDDLTVAQAAVIAGLPQSPTRYLPTAGRTDNEGNFLWQIRAQAVLRRMLEDNYIDQVAYDQALADLDTFTFTVQVGEIKAPHFVFYVEDQLRELYGDEMVDGGGLQVYTTLDYEIQASAEAIVKEEVDAVSNLGISNGAALVLEPETGEILAMVGSKDFFDESIDGQFNVVANPQALRQPGSSIKPLVYLALMMQQGATPATVFADVPTTFQQNEQIEAYTPRNYDGQFHGLVSLRQALANSYNIPAVKALAQVGLENFLEFAYNAGLSTLAPTKENLSNLGLSLSLGGGGIRMIELSSVYASFANGGYKVDPIAILEVKDRSGNTLFKQQPVQGEQIFGEGEVFLINSILSDNNARSAAFGVNSQLNTGLPIAVKTGTTNSLKDNWTVGWNQNFLVHTWVGNNDGSSMKSVVSGITGASPIWRAIVDKLVASGYETPAFTIPDNVEQLTVDKISGYPVVYEDWSTKTEYFIKNTAGTLPDPIHTKIAVCKGQNKIATDAQRSSGDADEKEFIIIQESDPVSEDGVNRFQIGIDNWIASQDDERYKYPTEMCGDNSQLSVTIYDLVDGNTVATDWISFRAQADSGAGIEKMELWLNDKLYQTYTDQSSFSVKLEQLPAQVHQVYVKAFSRDGQSAQSSTYRFGTSDTKVE